MIPPHARAFSLYSVARTLAHLGAKRAMLKHPKLPFLAVGDRHRRATERDEDVDPFQASTDGQAGWRQSIGHALDTVKADPEVQAFIRNANRNLGAIGYTEHGFRHVGLVANIARNILKRWVSTAGSRSSRRLPGISTISATWSAASITPAPAHCSPTESYADSARRRKTRRSSWAPSVPTKDEGHIGEPVHAVSAALILADKSDVHRSRVRNTDPTTFDQHDRVNYAATSSRLRSILKPGRSRSSSRSTRRSRR